MNSDWEYIGIALVGVSFWVMVAVITVGPAIAREWRKTHQAKSEAALKQAMVERGMSADEIVRVLQAGHMEEASSAIAAGGAPVDGRSVAKG
jgi:hypothetical protein